jgi:hypothetical protein
MVHTDRQRAGAEAHTVDVQGIQPLDCQISAADEQHCQVDHAVTHTYIGCSCAISGTAAEDRSNRRLLHFC